MYSEAIYQHHSHGHHESMSSEHYGADTILDASQNIRKSKDSPGKVTF